MIRKDETLGDGFVIGHSYFCVDDCISDEDVKAIIEYEIIPLLREYWFDEPSRVENWSNQLLGVVNGTNKN